MELSCIIPTYNRPDTLAGVLAGLSRQSYEGDFEVLVVDDGSAEAAAKEAEGFIKKLPGGKISWRYLRQDNKGPAAARNSGIRSARGEYLLLLGDDTIPDKYLIEGHMRLLKNDPGAASIGIVRRHPSSGNGAALTLKLSWIETDYSRIKDKGNCDFTYFCTANLGIARSRLQEEAFDEDFIYPAMEDVELGYRLSGKGLRLVLNEAGLVCHLHHYDEAGIMARQERIGLGVALLIKKHPELKKRFMTRKDACLSFLSEALVRAPFIKAVNRDLYCSALALRSKYKRLASALKEN